MALITQDNRYVRISINTGFDNTRLNISWLTFEDAEDWRNQNPVRCFKGIAENGGHQADLAIKESQLVELEEPYINEQGEEITSEMQEVIIGYHPQSLEHAHEILKTLDLPEARFASFDFQITNL